VNYILSLVPDSVPQECELMDRVFAVMLNHCIDGPELFEGRADSRIEGNCVPGEVSAQSCI